MSFNLAKIPAYDLRSSNHLQRTNTQTVHFGSESIKTLSAKLWNLIPEGIKPSKSFIIIKKRYRIGLPRVALVAFAGSMLVKLVS